MSHNVKKCCCNHELNSTFLIQSNKNSTNYFVDLAGDGKISTTRIAEALQCRLKDDQL
jgi:hypothetical protein